MHVDLWQVDLTRPATIDTLSNDERVRAQRLKIPHKQQQFIRARAGLRAVLADYVQTTPHGLRFGYLPQGKPYLLDFPDLHFNLSHAEDRALLAVAKTPVGIDLDYERSLVPGVWAQMIDMAFTAEEQTALHALPEAERHRAFYRTWVRKEALMKARGEGFKLAKTFSLPISSQPVQYRVDNWLLCDVPMPDGYIAAVAVAVTAS
ncbi:MAG: 4'-phosphopantetheinyl transferase superfamily protein [Anaerolineae bacterium]